MGKFPSDGRIAPRGAFKRVLRGLRARGGDPPGRDLHARHEESWRISVGDEGGRQIVRATGGRV